MLTAKFYLVQKLNLYLHVSFNFPRVGFMLRCRSAIFVSALSDAPKNHRILLDAPVLHVETHSKCITQVRVFTLIVTAVMRCEEQTQESTVPLDTVFPIATQTHGAVYSLKILPVVWVSALDV